MSKAKILAALALSLALSASPSRALSFGVYGPITRTAFVLETGSVAGGKPITMAFELFDVASGTARVMICRRPHLEVCAIVFGRTHLGEYVTVTGTERVVTFPDSAASCGTEVTELSAEGLTLEQKMPQ